MFFVSSWLDLSCHWPILLGGNKIYHESQADKGSQTCLQKYLCVASPPFTLVIRYVVLCCDGLVIALSFSSVLVYSLCIIVICNMIDMRPSSWSLIVTRKDTRLQVLWCCVVWCCVVTLSCLILSCLDCLLIISSSFCDSQPGLVCCLVSICMASCLVLWSGRLVLSCQGKHISGSPSISTTHEWRILAVCHHTLTVSTWTFALTLTLTLNLTSIVTLTQP